MCVYVYGGWGGDVCVCVYVRVYVYMVDEVERSTGSLDVCSLQI